MQVFHLTFLLLPILSTTSVHAKEKLLLAVQIPKTGTKDKFCFYAAITASVTQINKDDTILKNYEIETVVKKPIHPGNSLVYFYQFIRDKTRFFHGMIGPAYSVKVEAIGKATTIHNLPTVSYAANDEFGRLEEDEKTFPYVLRTSPVLRYFTAGKERLMRHFKWKRVTVVYDETSLLSINTVEDLTRILSRANVTVVKQLSFDANPKSILKMFDELQNVDARIIIAFVGQYRIRRVFCEAYKRGMYGPKHQWVLGYGVPRRSFEERDYHKYNCTKEEALAAAHNYISFDRSYLWSKNEVTTSGLTPFEGYLQMNTLTPGCSKLGTLAFDALYLMAVGLNKTLPYQGLNATGVVPQYTRERAEKLVKAMLNANITGLSGPIRFDKKTEERLSDIVVTQFKVFAKNTRYTNVEVAIYSMLNDNITFKTHHYLRIENVTFHIDGTHLFQDNLVPRDGVKTVKITETYGILLTSVLWSLAIIGILMSLFFLYVNIRYRHEKLIKMSSPNINNGIITGCIVCYTSVIVYGLDSQFISLDKVKYACNAVILLLSIGFTLSFGCLFSKTWRIYKIFTAVKSMHRVKIQDHHLYGTILVLLLVDVSLFIVWITVSPFKLVYEHRSTELLGDISQEYIFYKCNCEYQLHFTIVMFGYKGLLLLFGLFLAWETRHVKVAVLNDSKMIGMSIYNVSVVATIGAIGAIGLYQTSHFETGFILVTIAICLSTTVTLMLIFLPKIRILYSGSTHARKRATSSIVLHSTKLDMRRTNSNTSVSHINEDSFFGHPKSSSIYSPSRPSI